MVLPYSMANRILDNLIGEQRLRPTHVQAQDISERLHLAVSLTPSLPYFPSIHLHSLAHLWGKLKGAESFRRISIARVSPLSEHRQRRRNSRDADWGRVWANTLPARRVW